VKLVIADTGPINYLVLIGAIDVLPALFRRILLPSAVAAELRDRDAPPEVRAWLDSSPPWLELRIAVPEIQGDSSLTGLGEGEQAAIALAISLDADLLLMDDREAVTVARSRGLVVTGTLGVLDVAAERGLLVFSDAIERLRCTNFHRPEGLLDSLLRKHHHHERND
jgi:predicted nucleic acid-binding protein